MFCCIIALKFPIRPNFPTPNDATNAGAALISGGVGEHLRRSEPNGAQAEIAEFRRKRDRDGD
jgi:hypothetical protein